MTKGHKVRVRDHRYEWTWNVYHIKKKNIVSEELMIKAHGVCVTVLGNAPHCPTSPPIFLRHLCIFLLIIASPRRSALVAPIPESDDHMM